MLNLFVLFLGQIFLAICPALCVMTLGIGNILGRALCVTLPPYGPLKYTDTLPLNPCTVNMDKLAAFFLACGLVD